MEQLIKRLSDAVGIGHLRQATELAKAELAKYAEVEDFGTLGVIGRIDQNKPRTILLDAHIDEVGFVVTAVFEDGFLKVAPVGGIDPRILPAFPVTVHGKKGEIAAVFASTPPHLSKGETSVQEVGEILLDTGVESGIGDLVCVGDFVTYRAACRGLSEGRLAGKSFDDRCAVACLIEVAKRIAGKELPVNVIFSLAEYEELGTRGAKTASFAFSADEAVAIDVSFADAPDVPSAKCGKLGGGAMIGLSPVLSDPITKKLIDCAEKKNIPFQKEVMGGTTGTDADVISITKSGIPTGLVSIPLRNMHTPVEVIDLADIGSVCDLLEEYILAGGALCD